MVGVLNFLYYLRLRYYILYQYHLLLTGTPDVSHPIANPVKNLPVRMTGLNAPIVYLESTISSHPTKLGTAEERSSIFLPPRSAIIPPNGEEIAPPMGSRAYKVEGYSGIRTHIHTLSKEYLRYVCITLVSFRARYTRVSCTTTRGNTYLNQCYCANRNICNKVFG